MILVSPARTTEALLLMKMNKSQHHLNNQNIVRPHYPASVLDYLSWTECPHMFYSLHIITFPPFCTESLRGKTKRCDCPEHLQWSWLQPFCSHHCGRHWANRWHPLLVYFINCGQFCPLIHNSLLFYMWQKVYFIRTLTCCSALRDSTLYIRGNCFWNAPYSEQVVYFFLLAVTGDVVLSASKRAFALIDMSVHEGIHPCMGAVDLVPFYPLGEEVSMEDCAKKAQGKFVGICSRILLEKHSQPCAIFPA